MAAVRTMLNKPAEACRALGECFDRSNRRLASNPSAANFYETVLTDGRFAALRAAPEFKTVVDQHKPATK